MRRNLCVRGFVGASTRAVLPSLLPLGTPPGDALALVWRATPPNMALDLAAPPRAHFRVKFTVGNPIRAKSLHRSLILRFRKLILLLEPARMRPTRKLKSDEPPRSLDILLIMFLSRFLDFEQAPLRFLDA